MRSGPIEVIRRVPAPATRDQTEGEVVGASEESHRFRRSEAEEQQAVSHRGEILSKAWSQALAT